MKNYSRRELYAFGEALGESATRLKPGGRVYGGGGGGSMFGNVAPTATSTPTQQPAAPAPFSASTASPSAVPTQTPMSQVETQSGVSDYARPFVETMLGATQQQLFNYDPYGNVTGMQGYNPYSYNPADYFAAFTPLQQQAQYGIANLQSPYQTDMASGYLASLINRAAGTQYQPTPTGYDMVYGPGAQAYQLGQAPTAQAPTAQAAQLGNAPTTQAALTQAAQLGQAPTVEAPTAQAAQIGAAPTAQATYTQGAQLGQTPTINAAQMQGPEGIGYQNVYAPGMGAAQMQAAQTSFVPNLQTFQMGPAERVGAANVNAPTLNQLSMQAAAPVTAQQVGTPTMATAQTGYRPDLQQFQMGPAERVSTGSFTDQAQAYMNPYIQQALKPQLDEARRQADIASTRLGAQAAQAGAFGGSRYGIERAEAQRNLAQQIAALTGQGYSQAFQQAGQQYATDAARQLAAQQANQAAGLTTGQQNLGAQLATQQLGTQTGLQTALANLTSAQQANVQNQAAQLQTQGLNAQQALQAALANQQAQQQANLQNLSAGLQTQGLQAQTGMTAQQLNQQAGLQAALANQQAGLTTGQQNLAAQLGVQQLGSGQNLQAQLANLNNQQQAAVQNQAAQLQASGMNAQQAMQAALANQQAGMQTGQFNAQQQYNTALQNAQLQQQANLANQGLLGQFGLQQGQFGQQAALANQQAANQMALANQALAGQFGLQQGQFGQAANILNAQQRMQAALANQGLAGQFGLQQGQFGQQAGLANQQALNQANLANQALAGQFGLQQGQFGQAANILNAQQGLQAALANQGLAGQFGLQQGQFGQAANMLNAQQGLQAALANQQARQAANQLMAQQNQYGAGLGLQGLQAAMSGAGQLGGLGTSALQNQLGILGAQQQTGALQQQQQQQIINQAIQNYQTAQQYPYQQLGFMRNMLSGLPIGTESRQSYQQAPSMAQNLAALGMGAYGLGQLFGTSAPRTGTAGATGGINPITGALNTLGGYGSQALGALGNLFPGGGGFGTGSDFGNLDYGQFFADGGSVESPQNVESIVGRLSDQQLIQAEQAAQMRGDFDQLQAVQRERAMRASERGGLGGAFNQLPAPARTQMMAGGGIVAFNGEDDSLVYGPEGIPITGSSTTTGDDLTVLERLGIFNPENRRAIEAMEAAEAARKSGRSEKPRALPQPDVGAEAALGRPNVTDVTPRPARSAAPALPAPATQGPDTVAMMNELLTRQQGLQIPQQEDRETALRREMELRNKMVGDNPAIAMAQQIIDQQQAERGQALQQGKGLAALAAMRGMLQPGGFVKGLGESGGIFGEAYGKTLAQDREAAKLINQMQINMANAQYQQKIGNFDKAEDAREKAEKNKLDLYALQTGKIKGEADIVGKISERQLKEREIAELAKYRAQQANQETPIQKIADDLQRADKSLDRKSALMEASRIAGYGFRTEAGQSKAQTAALEKLASEYKMWDLIPDSPEKRAAMARYQQRRQEIINGPSDGMQSGLIIPKVVTVTKERD